MVLHVLPSPQMKTIPVAGPKKYIIFYFINFVHFILMKLFNLKTQEKERTYLPNAFFFFFSILLHIVYKKILWENIDSTAR